MARAQLVGGIHVPVVGSQWRRESQSLVFVQIAPIVPTHLPLTQVAIGSQSLLAEHVPLPARWTHLLVRHKSDGRQAMSSLHTAPSSAKPEKPQAPSMHKESGPLMEMQSVSVLQLAAGMQTFPLAQWLPG